MAKYRPNDSQVMYIMGCIDEKVELTSMPFSLVLKVRISALIKQSSQETVPRRFGKSLQ